MNKHARNNQYFPITKAFRESINHFFDTTLPTIGADLNTRINDKFQRFTLQVEVRQIYTPFSFYLSNNGANCLSPSH